MTGADRATEEAEDRLDRTDMEAFFAAMPFVREYAIQLVRVLPGQVEIELPFDARFSGPPGQFPASMVGVAGDVAAVSSCLSLLRKGWAPPTSISCRQTVNCTAARCWRPPATSRSSRRRRS